MKFRRKDGIDTAKYRGCTVNIWPENGHWMYSVTLVDGHAPDVVGGATQMKERCIDAARDRVDEMVERHGHRLPAA